MLYLRICVFVYFYLCIFISVFAGQTPRNIVSEVLLPLPFKTLPEAQRTQDIEFIIQIIFMAEIKQ